VPAAPGEQEADISAVPVGDVEVLVEADGYKPARKRARVNASMGLVVSLVLERAQ
jgi:hypothetical protein